MRSETRSITPPVLRAAWAAWLVVLSTTATVISSAAALAPPPKRPSARPSGKPPLVAVIRMPGGYSKRLTHEAFLNAERGKKNSQNVKHFSLKCFAGSLPISTIRGRLSLDPSPTNSDGK
jgi:hypothetical protein